MNIGDTVCFGRYPQTEDAREEPIEWIVLEKSSEGMLLIAKYALDCKPYHTKDAAVTWETCALRAWLNREFLDAAFTGEERLRIKESTVKSERNPDYEGEPGCDTADRVFLLGIAEAEKLFGGNNARICVPTAYAAARGAETAPPYGGTGAACWWWLRSPGNCFSAAAMVNANGSVSRCGYYIRYGNHAVRPVLRTGPEA